MEPYVGEIRLWAGTFIPAGWAICDGSVLPVVTYMALYTILANRYGGNGTTTFALPDLRDRAPVALGARDYPGQTGRLGTSTSATVKTVALRYIICTQGCYPERSY